MGMFDNDFNLWDMCDEREEPSEPEILIDAKVIRSTKKAILVIYNGKTAWFPKSLIHIVEKDCITYDAWFDPEWQIIYKKKMNTIEGDFE